MGVLKTQVENLVNGYVRKGGKVNRRQQAKRMIEFAVFCETLGVDHISKVGARQAIEYYKKIKADNLSERTRYAHALAIQKLWELANKNGRAPKIIL